MADIETGAGIGRDAGAGNDLAGRDYQNQGNQVHIAMERLSEVSARETDVIQELSRQIGALAGDVTALTRALVGDQKFGATGLVQEVQELRANAQRREVWRLVSTWLLVVLTLGSLVQWWLLWQVYELYWIIYQAVN